MANLISGFDVAVDAIIAVLFLLAAIILRISIAEHVETKIQLRLAENERCPPPVLATLSPDDETKSRRDAVGA